MADGGISRLYILNDVLQQNQRGRMRWKLDEGRWTKRDSVQHVVTSSKEIKADAAGPEGLEVCINVSQPQRPEAPETNPLVPCRKGPW